MGFNRNYFQIFIISLLALIQSCLVSTDTQTRIVGGTATTINKIPYLVHLRDYHGLLCGGSIVAQSYIVTAAHCVKGRPLRSLTVVAGTGKLSGHGRRSKVVKIMLPKAFNFKTLTMDVAVLKLKKPLRGRNIRPIGLCNSDWKPGAIFKVSGWGQMTETSLSFPNQVRTVNVKSIPNSICAAKYARKKQKITETMFCASIPGLKDSCSGDSGGPAVHNGKLCGIVAHGFGCGRRAYPGVYTNVNKVKTFILNAMKK